LELPSDIPVGTATLQLTITPTVKPKKSWDDLRKVVGILKDSPLFQGETVELQRKLRDE
jgi:hypothetical protein